MTLGSQNAFVTDTLAYMDIRDLFNPCKYPPQIYSYMVGISFSFYRSTSCKIEVVCVSVMTGYVMQYEFTNILYCKVEYVL